MAQIIATKENDRQRIVLWDNLADGAYAAANVYGEIEQRLDIALPGDRGITVALTRGNYDVRYDAETDTLQIGCDESDDSEIDCHAEVGGPLVSQTDAATMVGNIYHCRANAEIVEIEQYLNAAAPLRIEYFVYAANDQAALSMPLSGLNFTAPFDLLARAIVENSPAGQRFHSSGPIRIPLQHGKFYFIGAAWNGTATHFWGGGHPISTPFGHSVGGYMLDFDGVLPRTLWQPPQANDRAHYQQITLDGKGVFDAVGADLIILDIDGLPDLHVGTINVSGSGISRILTNVAIAKIIGGPSPEFFGGSLDPTDELGAAFSVKVNRIFSARRNSHPSCGCRKMYAEPREWRDFESESGAQAYYDSLEPVPRPAAINVTAGGLDVAGCVGGPFRPNNNALYIQNTGSDAVDWSASASEPWLMLSSAGGTLAEPGDEDELIVTLAAEALCTGKYSGTVVIVNETTGLEAASRTFSVEVLGRRTPDIAPDDGFDSEGGRGGPFSPAEQTWTLTNTDDCAMEWSAVWSATWLNVSPGGGWIAPGSSINVVASLTAEAEALPAGRHNDRIVFHNLTSGREKEGRVASLFILP